MRSQNPAGASEENRRRSRAFPRHGATECHTFFWPYCSRMRLLAYPMTMARSRALLKTRNQPDLLRSVDSRLRLKQHLQSILDQFDFIIIGTPPTLGIFTQAPLVASTEIPDSPGFCGKPLTY